LNFSFVTSLKAGALPFAESGGDSAAGECAEAVRKPGQMNVNNARAIIICFLTLVLIRLENNAPHYALRTG
jgi:hypothetical protein